MAVKCDVSQEEEVKVAFKKARAEFGGVDVCVNNAGLAHNAPLLSGATSDWKSMLDVRKYGKLTIIGPRNSLDPALDHKDHHFKCLTGWSY